MSGTLCTAQKGTISINKNWCLGQRPLSELLLQSHGPFPTSPGGLPTGVLKEPKLQKLMLGKKPQHLTEGQSACSSLNAEKKKLCPVYFSTSPASLQAYHFPRVLVSQILVKEQDFILSLKSKGVGAGGRRKGNHRSAVLEGLSMDGCLCLYR